MPMDSVFLRTLNALVANAASLLRPREQAAIFLERDERSVLGVRVASPRSIGAADVICRRPRPTVAPGALVRMLIGPGFSFAVKAESDFVAALAELRDCLEVSAVLVSPSTSSVGSMITQKVSYRRLPVVIRIDWRKGARLLLVDAKAPLEFSTTARSVLLTVSLAGSLLFRSDVSIVDGHLHTSICNHQRERAGHAFQAAVDGNLYNLRRALQPTGLRLWCRGGFGDSTEETIDDVRGRVNHGSSFLLFHILHFPQGSSTPILGCAASWGDLGVVEVLIRAGAETGETALQNAACEGHTDVVRRMLIDTRIDINFPNADGNAALHLAVSQGRTNVLFLLLADPFLDTYVKNCRGRTAFDIARARGNANIIELLEREVRQRWR